MPFSISKQSSNVPDWMLKVSFPNHDKKEAANALSIKTENDMISAKSNMEKCAKEGKPFYFESGITSDQKKELEEYAEACNMDKKNLVGISKKEKEIASSVKSSEPTKMAPEKDPFGIMNSFAKKEVFEKNKSWEKVEKAKKLGKSETSSGVVRADGIENDSEQRIVGVRSGENSIASPNNIGTEAKSQDLSARQKTIEANNKRKEKITFKAKEWEKEQAEKYKSGVIISSGIKLTEAAMPQSRSKVADGQHSIFDDKDNSAKLPEKTVGETLKASNEKRKQEIQRPTTEDRSWDKESSSKKPVVSDSLYESLKKQMSKNKKGKN